MMITLNNIEKFIWKFIICRQQKWIISIFTLQGIINIFVSKFDLLVTLISNNSKQFRNSLEFYANLKIRQWFTFVEHLQSNGQAELANKVILKRLKKGLDETRG